MSRLGSLRTVLFINTHSRRARNLADKVVKDFGRERPGFDLVEVIIVKNLKQLNYHLDILKAVKRLDCVIVGGGDGTIVAVLETLKGRDIIYGFLPLGTSNTFMRSLGLPLTYQLAKRLILKQQIRPASLGAVNGKIFANIAGIGIPVEVTENTTNKIKKVLGPLAYLFNGIKAMVGHQALYCHVVNDDTDESFYTHYLIFANGKYHGNVSLGKEVSAYNDKLVLFAIGVSEYRRHFAVAIIKVLLRRYKKDRQVKIIPFERLHVTTQPVRGIEADGEIISQTPATVEILKDAIQVFAKPIKPPKARRIRRSPSSKRRKSRS